MLESINKNAEKDIRERKREGETEEVRNLSLRSFTSLNAKLIRAYVHEIARRKLILRT